MSDSEDDVAQEADVKDIYRSTASDRYILVRLSVAHDYTRRVAEKALEDGAITRVLTETTAADVVAMRAELRALSAQVAELAQRVGILGALGAGGTVGAIELAQWIISILR